MTHTTLRILLASILAAAALPAAAQTVPSGLTSHITRPGDTNVSQQVVLGLNQSMIVDLDMPAADVVISNPEIADATVSTSRRIIFRGVRHGMTHALIFDRAGQVLLELNISVETDFTALNDAITRQVPDARVRLEGLNGSIVVSGEVPNLSQADQVMRMVAAYAEESGGPQIINLVSVTGSEQVFLEVRVVEMQRSLIKQLGIGLTGRPGFGQPARFDIVNSIRGEFATSLGLAVQGGSLGGLGGSIAYTNFVGDILQSQIGATFTALERIGALRTLAEPTIVAMSGETANFLAGGEFPVPTGQDNNGRIQFEYKPFGVGLSFTPVVLSQGRISLRVSTEVSELTTVGAAQADSRTIIGPDGQPIVLQGITLPALAVRRAESVIELPSGSSMMLAGLISVRDRQSLDQVPGLKRLPVLGALFQSRDFLTEETELVVIVTPYLVNPASRGQMITPAEGYANASDARTIFFGKLNETYGRDGAPVRANEYRAPVGFVEE